jgi:hypothetical protein
LTPATNIARFTPMKDGGRPIRSPAAMHPV